jgi:hypothetical protein
LVWRYTPIVPAFKRLKQEDFDSEASLQNIMRLSQKPKTNKQKPYIF